MIRSIFTALIFLIILGCNNNNSSQQTDVQVKENDTIKSVTVKDEKIDSSVTQKKAERKLRYLFYANGGLVGYFDDGTITGCARCDLLKENVEALYSAKPIKTYTIQKDGSLLVNKDEKIYPKEKDKNGNKEWAMINYKWLVKL